MAMGPKNQTEKIETSRFDRIQYTAKKVSQTYFEKPLYYLFYGLLTSMSIVLLFNGSLPWQFYVLMAGLSLIQIYNWRTPAKSIKKST